MNKAIQRFVVRSSKVIPPSLRLAEHISRRFPKRSREVLYLEHIKRRYATSCKVLTGAFIVMKVIIISVGTVITMAVGVGLVVCALLVPFSPLICMIYIVTGLE